MIFKICNFFLNWQSFVSLSTYFIWKTTVNKSSDKSMEVKLFAPKENYESPTNQATNEQTNRPTDGQTDRPGH